MLITSTLLGLITPNCSTCAHCILEQTKLILCNLNNRWRYNNLPKFAVLERFWLILSFFPVIQLRISPINFGRIGANFFNENDLKALTMNTEKINEFLSVGTWRFANANKLPLSVMFFCYKLLLKLIQSLKNIHACCQSRLDQINMKKQTHLSYDHLLKKYNDHNNVFTFTIML